MKELLFVLALAVATIQTTTAVTRESVRIFHECMRELGIKSFQSEEFITKFDCITVCEDEKAGMVVNDKYIEQKYIQSYMRRFPKAGLGHTSILAECLQEANKENDKCDVGRALQNCQIKNRNFLFVETNDKYNNTIKYQEDN